MKHARGIGLYVLSAAALAGLSITTTAPAQSLRTLAIDASTSSRVQRDYHVALRKFRKLSERQQRRVLAEVRGAVASIESRYLRSRSAFAAAGTESNKPRYKARRPSGKGKRSETAVGEAGSLYDALPIRTRYEYRFAYGDIATPDLVKKGTRVNKRTRNKARALAEIQNLCAGFAVDADLALAALLRELDNDRSADHHAVFLERWHNGAETFYQALARTAGTGKGVFCYDAMLGEWVRTCVPKKHADRKMMLRSMDNAQRAFYQTAATYRAYRSLREVVAMSLILPSDQRLPGYLGRLFEDNGANGYSTRDVIELILAGHGNDVGATVRTILIYLERLPADPWKGGFNAVHGLHAAQDALMDKLTAGGLGTDEVLARFKRERNALRDRIAAVARTTFVNAL